MERGRRVSGGPTPEGYLDIYKLAVEMADRVSARRATANSFFLTVLSTLVALVGFTDADTWTLALPGLVVAGAWALMITSYRRLNRAKWSIISEMETELPAAPFSDEWKLLKGSKADDGEADRMKWRDRYMELGIIEFVVPVVFFLIFAGILICDLT